MCIFREAWHEADICEVWIFGMLVGQVGAFTREVYVKWEIQIKLDGQNEPIWIYGILALVQSVDKEQWKTLTLQRSCELVAVLPGSHAAQRTRA